MTSYYYCYCIECSSIELCVTMYILHSWALLWDGWPAGIVLWYGRRCDTADVLSWWTLSLQWMQKGELESLLSVHDLALLYQNSTTLRIMMHALKCIIYILCKLPNVETYCDSLVMCVRMCVFTFCHIRTQTSSVGTWETQAVCCSASPEQPTPTKGCTLTWTGAYAASNAVRWSWQWASRL